MVTAYEVCVSLYDAAAQSFELDADSILVGRGADCDVQLLHRDLSRRQLRIDRVIAPDGELRFRVIPEPGVRNPVLLNGKPAIEQAIRYGDVLAVGEARLVLRRARARRDAKAGPSKVRLAAMGAVLVALVGVVALSSGSAPSLAPLHLEQQKLFAHLPEVSCADPTACVERARAAFAHGQTYAKQGASVPGNWYRAALEFYRAAQFERLAGGPAPGLERLADHLADAARRAETTYNDLQFQLARDLKAGDAAALRDTIDAILLVVPDENHPIRQTLAEYVRLHPLPKKGSRR